MLEGAFGRDSSGLRECKDDYSNEELRQMVHGLRAVLEGKWRDHVERTVDMVLYLLTLIIHISYVTVKIWPPNSICFYYQARGRALGVYPLEFLDLEFRKNVCDKIIFFFIK